MTAETVVTHRCPTCGHKTERPVPRSYTPWTVRERAVAADVTLTSAQVAAQLGRSYSSVKAYRDKMRKGTR